ncbi:MAG: hypothetical protein ABFS17_08595 [Chloroflexota bacterium]
MKSLIAVLLVAFGFSLTYSPEIAFYLVFGFVLILVAIALSRIVQH